MVYSWDLLSPEALGLLGLLIESINREEFLNSLFMNDADQRGDVESRMLKNSYSYLTHYIILVYVS